MITLDGFLPVLGSLRREVEDGEHRVLSRGTLEGSRGVIRRNSSIGLLSVEGS